MKHSDAQYIILPNDVEMMLKAYLDMDAMPWKESQSYNNYLGNKISDEIIDHEDNEKETSPW